MKPGEEIAISVTQLSKCFELNQKHNDSLKSDLFHNFKNVFSGDIKESDDIFWALKNISFQLKHGETLGLIGANGAGKSTLLKILSGISSPTSGKVELNGTVASILDIGTGFHPDLTGRENIFLSGELIGMTKSEISNRYLQIVEFSGIKDFIDTPVKYYSSGMYIRLAFSVIAFLEADIMIFDEVISVGDAEFTMQCKKKLEELTRKGKTLIIASHNMNELFNYCHHTIRLEKGEIVSEGETGNQISNYLEDVYRKQKLKQNQITDKNHVMPPNTQVWEKANGAPANIFVRLHRFSVFTQRTDSEAVFYYDENIYVEFVYEILQHVENCFFGMVVRTLEGYPVFTSETNYLQSNQNGEKFKASCVIPAQFLNQGIFTINLHFVESKTFSKLPFEAGFKILFKKESNKDIPLYFGPVKPVIRWQSEKLI